MLTERDLLLALRAVEQGAVTTEQALRAIADRSGAATLLARLQDHGALTPEARQRLEATLPATEVEATLRSPTPGRAPAAPGELSLEDPGRYTLVDHGAGIELGRGGGGRVLIALDRHLGRQVAVKELLPADLTADPSTSASLMSQFVHEARLTGQLEHPGIVPVYEVGRRADGSLYYTMKLLRGRTLQSALDAARDLRARLALLDRFAALCQAVAFAHSRHVIHCDLKPANVMVGEYGETIVIDWGLARSRELPPALDGLLGTPLYMSPEQAQGDPSLVDARSDVWALGVILYELVAGRRPFGGQTVGEVLEALEHPPLPLDRACPDAPRELVSIAHKALSHDPSRRYPDARALAADVEAFLEGRRVGAHGYRSWELLRRFAARNRAAVAATGVVLLILVASLVTVSMALRRESAAKVREREERVLASYHLAQAFKESASRTVERREYLEAAVFAAAGAAANPAEPGGPLSSPDFARGRPASRLLAADNRGLHLRAQFRPVRGLLRQVPFHRAEALAFSPDGRWLAAGDDLDGFLVVETATGREVLRGRAGGQRLGDLVFSRDGKLLFTASGVVEAWSLPGGQRAWAREDLREENLRRLAVSPDGRSLAAGGAPAQATLLDARTGETVARHALPYPPTTLAFQPDGAALAVASQKGAWRLDLPEGARETLREEPSQGLAFLPSGHLAISAPDPRIHLWHRDPGARRTFALPRDSSWSLAASSDGAWLVGVGSEGIAQILDARSGRTRQVLHGRGDVGAGLALSPDGHTLALAGPGTLQLWDVRPAAGLHELDEDVLGLAASADGRTLATVRADGSVGLWNRAGEPLGELRTEAGTTVAAALSPDGRRAFTLRTHSGALHAWDVATRTLLWTQPLSGRPITLAVSPSGEWVATSGPATPLQLRRTDTGALVETLDPEGPGGADLAFAPDGCSLLVATLGRAVDRWSLPSGPRLLHLPLPYQPFAVAFSPDGTEFAVGNSDAGVSTHRGADGGLVREYLGAGGSVANLSYSPDGQILAAGCEPGEAVVWTRASGDLRLRLWTSDSSYRTLLFPGGFAFMGGGTALLGDGAPFEGQVGAQELLDRAQRQAGLRVDGFELVEAP